MLMIGKCLEDTVKFALVEFRAVCYNHAVGCEKTQAAVWPVLALGQGQAPEPPLEQVQAKHTPQTYE
jgi:hypothetical protein